MADSIVVVPEGYRLTTDFFSTFGCTDDSGDALFSSTDSHLLTDGDVIYITSNVGEYNGFWEVDSISSTTWKLVNPDGGFVQFVGSLTDKLFFFTRTDSFEIEWSCVHLPIVYKISNTFWPTNSADTARTISGVTDSNGYCEITASGDIKASGSAAKLEFVKISGAGDDYDGVYQIIEYTSDTVFVINLAYSAAISSAITGTTIQYYYNNYHARIRVHAGLPATSPFYDQRPYEVLAELKGIPDENNIVTVNISEILKSHIKTRNNAILGTLPNNIDFWTSFFISIAEAYDDSDGTTLSTFVTSYNQELAEHCAANAKLPFKNRYSGFLIEYLGEGLKFMTLFDTPVVWPGKYYDVSFIIDDVGTVTGAEWALIKNFQGSQETVKMLTEDGSFTEYGRGIYRVPIEFEEGDTDYVIALQQYISNPETWTEVSGTWTQTTTYVETVASGTKIIAQELNTIGSGIVIPSFTITITISGTWTGFVLVTIRMRDSAGATASNQFGWQYNSNVTSENQVISFTTIDDVSDMAITVSKLTGSGTATVRIEIPVGEPLAYGLFSEVKNITVDTSCTKPNVDEIYMTWLNYLGGFDYWNFTAEKEHGVNVLESQTIEENILPNWPNSYGRYAHTTEKQTYRRSKETLVVRSQHLTLEQVKALKYLRTSPVVQAIGFDDQSTDGFGIGEVLRKTVIVDSDSFKVYDEGEKLYELTFKVHFTDEIPSQPI